MTSPAMTMEAQEHCTEERLSHEPASESSVQKNPSTIALPFQNTFGWQLLEQDLLP